MRIAVWSGAPLGGVMGVVLAAALVGCAARPVLRGPAPVRNQHPAQLTVLHLEPRDARPAPAGAGRVRLDLSYSSLFLAGSTNGGPGAGGSGFEMDGEILRAGLAARVGLGAELELGVELPLLHTTGGFLDEFLIDWHDFFGFPDQGRTPAQNGRFAVRAVDAGSVVFEQRETSLALGDVPTVLSWTFLPQTARRPFGAGVRIGAEWPTGDDDRGFGSGQVDWGGGVYAAWRSGAWQWSAHAGHSRAGNPAPARRNGFSFGDVTAGGVGVEWAFHDDWAVLVQVEAETSTLRALDFGRASDPQWLLWTTARGRLAEGWWLDVGFGEDLSSFVAPDFTAYVGLSAEFGHR